MIPVQNFFDLIVGTSAGGIIALGLGVENWSVERCTQEFERMCKGAFTPRKGGNILFVGWLISAHLQSKYATGPLEAALSDAFTDEYLFGGQQSFSHGNKVALIATASAGLRPVVLSNYNRVCTDDASRPYIFQRPEKPEPELKIWEAARGTSAAPTYHRSFAHDPSKQMYLDGGLHHNNPINIADAEQKVLWPESATSDPDIILSIGSGYCPHQEHDASTTSIRTRFGIVANLKALYRIAVDHIESSLDAERLWKNYVDILSPSEGAKHRFQRLNVPLPYDAPPKLDDLDCLNELKKDVRKYFADHRQIQDIAKHLIATSFFFEQTSPWHKQEDGSHACEGSIQCRFVPGSREIREFGKLLLGFVTERHMPFFVIEEVYREQGAEQVSYSSNSRYSTRSKGLRLRDTDQVAMTGRTDSGYYCRYD